MTQRKILVISSHMMPVDNFGTACLFSLLPVPWSRHDFEGSISEMLQQEMNIRDDILSQPSELIFDVDAAMLERGLGLRFWLIDDAQYCKSLNDFRMDKFNSSRDEYVLQLVDSVSLRDPDLIYTFSECNFNVHSELANIRMFIHEYLRNADPTMSEYLL